MFNLIIDFELTVLMFATMTSTLLSLILFVSYFSLNLIFSLTFMQEGENQRTWGEKNPTQICEEHAQKLHADNDQTWEPGTERHP